MTDFGTPDTGLAVHPSGAVSIDPTLVLVVSSMPINRIVVARIAERCGLRAEALDPSEAGAFLAQRLPAAIILDGGADNRDCDGLLDELAFRREGAEDAAPAVIFLSTSSDVPEGLPVAYVADAVVAKPITPDVLQPTIQRLTDNLRAAV
ncbi:MAG: response regulator [Rhizobiaceae bacterium]|nr:response regulator [Rhizobiaceae bacterium]MCV0406105.1 response regulator [Rhizobiaceae bacterium]